MVPRLLRGDETWCQGFSEPGTGSNLAALSCRATRSGDVWRVTGQKVWTSLAQYADRCVLLTRTGAPESAHQGITALFVDMDSPGIDVRPIETMHGLPEFSEVFFDDVAVPVDRTLGRGGPGLVGGHGPAPVRAEHGAVASCRLPAPAIAAPPRHRPAGRARPRRRRRGHPAALRAAGPVPGHAVPAGGRRTPRSRDLHRQGAGGHRRTGAVRPGRPTGSAPSWRLATTRPANGGGASSSTPGRRRSTAEPPRSSGTSSPADCSTSDPTADGRRRSRALRAERPPGLRDALRCGTRPRPRRARMARRALGGPPDGRVAPVRDSRARRTPPLGTRCRPRLRASAVETGPTAGVVLPALGEWRPPGEIVGGVLVRPRPRHRRHSSTGPPPLSPPVPTTAHWSLEVATADLTLRPVQGIDPDLGLVEVTGAGVPLARTVIWPRATGRGRCAGPAGRRP